MSAPARACEVCGVPLQASAEEGLLVCPRCNDWHVSEDALAVSLSGEGEQTAQLAGRIVFTAEMRKRFFMQRVIGRGGMGMVVEAGDRKLGRAVAIKFLTRLEDENALARFLQEGRVLSEMRHPNVLSVFEVGHMEGAPYLVCELLDGGTLRDRLDRERRLAPKVAVPLAVSCLAGLAAFHERGIVHRDIKPQNILFDRAGRPKIADLGLAKDFGGGERLTLTGTILGTPKYMSPEQCRGEKVTAASDVYSMAVVVYEMLAGKPPFADEPLFVMITRHMEDAPPPLRDAAPEVPAALAEVVHRALAKDPAVRPPAAADLSKLLKASIESKPKKPEPGPVTRPEVAAQKGGRPLLAAAAGTVAALLAISIGLAQRPTRWGPAPVVVVPSVRPVRVTQLAVSRPEIVAPSPAVLAAVAKPPPALAPAPQKRTPPPRLASPSPSPSPSPEAPWLQPVTAPAVRWRFGHAPYQHPGWLAALAFHGGQLVTAGRDGVLCWWDPATGDRTRLWRGEGARVTHAALATYRPVMACAHEDGTVSLWDCSTDKPIEIRKESVAAREVAVSAAGDRVAALTADGEVWVVAERAKAVRLAGKGITGFAFTRSGREVVTREAAPAVKVWSADTGALVRVFAIEEKDARLVAASDEAVYLAANGVLSGYTLTGSRMAWGAAPAAIAAGVAADGRQIVAASDAGLMRFDAASGVASEVEGGALPGVRMVALSEDGRQFAVAAEDGVFRAGDAVRGLAGANEQTGLRVALALSPDGRTLALAASRQIVVVDLARRKALARKTAEAGLSAVALAGSRLVTAGAAGLTVRQDDAAGFRSAAELMLASPVTALGVAADGAVAIGCADGRALVFRDVAAPPTALRAPAGVLAIQPAAGARTCAMAHGPDGAVRVFEMGPSPAVVKDFAVGRLVTHAAIAPDGARAFVASGFDEMAVWNVANGTRMASWNVRYGADVALFTAGTLCAWSDAEGAVHVWRDGGTLVRKLAAGSPVVKLAGSADTRILAALSADGTITVWQLP